MGKNFFKFQTGLNNERYWEYRGLSPSCILREVWVQQISLHHLPHGGEGRDIFKPSKFKVIELNKSNQRMELHQINDIG